MACLSCQHRRQILTKRACRQRDIIKDAAYSFKHIYQRSVFGEARVDNVFLIQQYSSSVFRDMHLEARSLLFLTLLLHFAALASSTNSDCASWQEAIRKEK